MSDEPPAPMEGWNISSRLVLAGMVTIVVVLALALTLTEHRYRATIEPATHPRVHHFPAPRLDGFDDPARPTPTTPAQTPLSNAALAAALKSPLPLAYGRLRLRGEGWERGNQEPTPPQESPN